MLMLSAAGERGVRDHRPAVRAARGRVRGGRQPEQRAREAARRIRVRARPRVPGRAPRPAHAARDCAASDSTATARRRTSSGGRRCSRWWASRGSGSTWRRSRSDVNRFVVPVPPLGHWWTVPALILNSAEAALKEEVIVVAYLVTRLRQLGWSDRALDRGQRAAARLLPPVSGPRAGSRATSRWACCSRGCSRGRAAPGHSWWRTSCSMWGRGWGSSCSGSTSPASDDERILRPVPGCRPTPKMDARLRAAEREGCRRCRRSWSTCRGGACPSWCCPHPGAVPWRRRPVATASRATRW